ncbi:hypothetical protein FIBSPDRAFT_420945 [Athelia psychrophila]|uniref:Uncharacterized protein n=1 Tax=Athelia psychrophila TaxID=1759441 RepID=A0A167USB4_9AGAM|nr:hypothetical protein FIBSPDRAFT_420945 [Fibularhizoctonia sp. CBS 109695]
MSLHIIGAIHSDPVDVHIPGVSITNIRLATFSELTACGGSSFRNVLRARNHWAVPFCSTAPHAESLYELLKRQRAICAPRAQWLPIRRLATRTIVGLQDGPAFKPNKARRSKVKRDHTPVVVPPVYGWMQLCGGATLGEWRASFTSEDFPVCGSAQEQLV